MRLVRGPGTPEVFGGCQHVFVIVEFTPVVTGVFDHLGRAAEIGEIHSVVRLVLPSANALVPAVIQGVENDADMAAGHVVGTCEELAVLGIAKDVQRLEDDRGGHRGRIPQQRGLRSLQFGHGVSTMRGTGCPPD